MKSLRQRYLQLKLELTGKVVDYFANWNAPKWVLFRALTRVLAPNVGLLVFTYFNPII